MINFGKYRLNLMVSSAIIPVQFNQLDVVQGDGYLLFDHDPNTRFDERGIKFISEKSLETRNKARKKEKTVAIEDARCTSGNLVVPILINNTFFTTIFNLVPYVYKLYKADPSICFILNRTENHFNVDEIGSALNNLFEFVKRFFDSEGINYIYIDADDPPTAVKVFRYVDFSRDADARHDLSFGDVLKSTKQIKKYLEIDESAVPFRKVYLSRKHLAMERDQQLTLKLGGEGRFTSDVRMYDEEVLEEYFKSKGYEIVIPERDFTSIEDQIKYMSEVKVMASVSGSGFTNIIFMLEGNYVLDLGAELVFSSGELGAVQVMDNQHWLYNSYINHQTYISVPTRRNPYQAVERLDKLFKVLDI